MKYLIFGSLLAIMLPLCVSAETVTSDNFVLHDASGRTTAQLTTSGEGTPSLFIYDTKGVPRITIGLYPDGAPGVVLNDEKGLAAAILRLVYNNGNPVLVLKEDGQDRYILTENSAAASSGMLTVAIAVALSSMISVVLTLLLLRRRDMLAPQQVS